MLCDFDGCYNIIDGTSMYCKRHNNKFMKPKKTYIHKKRKRIRPISKKRSLQNDLYKKIKDSWIKINNKCNVCKHPATDVHHKKGRAGDLLLDSTLWIPVCRQCHIKITNESKWALDKGLSILRSKK